MLEYWKATTKTNWSVRLVECPSCGADLEDDTPATHLHHEHSPEDFGLTFCRTIATDGGEQR